MLPIIYHFQSSFHRDSNAPSAGAATGVGLSILFSSRLLTAQGAGVYTYRLSILFSSRQSWAGAMMWSGYAPFNPLFIETNTQMIIPLQSLGIFQSSFHRDCCEERGAAAAVLYFQSSFHRDRRICRGWSGWRPKLSILFSSRRWYHASTRPVPVFCFQSSFHRDEELQKIGKIIPNLFFQSSFHRDLKTTSPLALAALVFQSSFHRDS